MKAKTNNDDNNTWIEAILGVIAFFAIRSIFEHDNSKIVSKKGFNLLSDDKKMIEVNRKIKKLEAGNNQKEIII